MTDASSPAPSKTARHAAPKQKVPPFARYKGTSAWRKDRRRARAYAEYLASVHGPKQASGSAAPLVS